MKTQNGFTKEFFTKLLITFSLVAFTGIFFVSLPSEAASRSPICPPDGFIEVKDWPRPPTIKIEVLKDAAYGYNLHVITTDFIFSGEHVNGDLVDGEGHAHLLINGVPQTRLYGDWFYIDSLPQGNATVIVTLNSNQHGCYTLNGRPIAAIQKLRVNEETHRH